MSNCSLNAAFVREKGVACPAAALDGALSEGGSAELVGQDDAECSTTMGSASVVDPLVEELNGVFVGATKSKQVAVAIAKLCTVLQEKGGTAEENLIVLCELSAGVAKHAPQVLQSLCESGLIDGEAIQQWHSTTEQSNLFMTKSRPYVEWLNSKEE